MKGSAYQAHSSTSGFLALEFRIQHLTLKTEKYIINQFRKFWGQKYRLKNLKQIHTMEKVWNLTNIIASIQPEENQNEFY